jgi:hypothetical protein
MLPVVLTKKSPKVRARPAHRAPQPPPQPSSEPSFEPSAKPSGQPPGHPSPQATDCVLKGSLVYDCHKIAGQVLRAEATKQQQLTSISHLLDVVRQPHAAALAAPTLQSRAKAALSLLDRTQENQTRFYRQRFAIQGNLVSMAGVQLAGPAALRTLAWRFPKVPVGYWHTLGVSIGAWGLYKLFAGQEALQKNRRTLREANLQVDSDFQTKFLGRSMPSASIAFTERCADLVPQRRQLLRDVLVELSATKPD